MLGRVEQYLIDSINEQGAIHLTLLDPEKVTRSSAKALAKAIDKSGSAAIMIGGSTAVSVYHTDYRSSAKAFAKAIDKSGSAAIMIGGSTAVSVYHTMK